MEGGSVTPPGPGSPESRPETPGRRLSAAVYAFEYSLVVTVLLMMVMTYILTVLWNNAHLPYDQFDQLVLRIAGYSTPEEASPQALDLLAGVVSPIALIAVLMLLSYLAVRTREESTARLAAEAEEAGTEPPRLALGPLSRALARIESKPLRRLVWSALITGFMWGFVQLVAVLPASLVCVVALAFLGGGLVLNIAQKGIGRVHARGLKGFALGLAAGVLLALIVDGNIGGWIGIGAAVAAAALLVHEDSELVVGVVSGFALAPGVDGFLDAQIPGFIALAGSSVFLMYFLGARLATILGALCGGAFLFLYFVLQAGIQYGWTSGLTSILLMYVGFVGASMATHDGRHIAVDAIRKNLKSKNFHLYNAIGDIVTLLFTTFLCIMAVRYLIHLKVGGDMHPPSELSAWISAIPIGFGFMMMAVRFGIRIVSSLAAWRRGEPAPELAPELH